MLIEPEGRAAINGLRPDLQKAMAAFSEREIGDGLWLNDTQQAIDLVGVMILRHC